MRLGRGDTPFCGYNVGAARHDALDGMHAMVASGDGYFSEYVTHSRPLSIALQHIVPANEPDATESCSQCTSTALRNTRQQRPNDSAPACGATWRVIQSLTFVSSGCRYRLGALDGTDAQLVVDRLLLPSRMDSSSDSDGGAVAGYYPTAAAEADYSHGGMQQVHMAGAAEAEAAAAGAEAAAEPPSQRHEHGLAGPDVAADALPAAAQIAAALQLPPPGEPAAPASHVAVEAQERTSAPDAARAHAEPLLAPVLGAGSMVAAAEVRARPTHVVGGDEETLHVTSGVGHEEEAQRLAAQEEAVSAPRPETAAGDTVAAAAGAGTTAVSMPLAAEATAARVDAAAGFAATPMAAADAGSRDAGRQAGAASAAPCDGGADATSADDGAEAGRGAHGAPTTAHDAACAAVASAAAAPGAPQAPRDRGGEPAEGAATWNWDWSEGSEVQQAPVTTAAEGAEAADRS